MKNSQHQKLVRTRSNQNSYVLWVGIYTGARTLENRSFLKELHIHLLSVSQNGNNVEVDKP